VTAGEPGTHFDSHPDRYEAECMNGLSLSGESMAFFARGRIAHLRRWWLAAGRDEPRRVIDYGCGTGSGTALLPEFFAESEILGLDPSASYVEEARRRWGSSRVRFEQLGPGAGGEPADLIHVNGVLHHVVPAERPAFFADAVARLGERGVLALFENNPWNPGARLVMRRIEFDRDAVMVPPREGRARMRAAGLRVEWTRFLFYFPRPLRALRPLEPWLAQIPLGAQYAVFGSRNGV